MEKFYAPALLDAKNVYLPAKIFLQMTTTYAVMPSLFFIVVGKHHFRIA
jgi:hypothetical protein